jgi:hypothetical protein
MHSLAFQDLTDFLHNQLTQFTRFQHFTLRAPRQDPALDLAEVGDVKSDDHASVRLRLQSLSGMPCFLRDPPGRPGGESQSDLVTTVTTDGPEASSQEMVEPERRRPVKGLAC